MSKVLLLDFPQLLSERFLQTDIGQLYQSIPFDELASTIAAPKHQKSGNGCKPWFNVQGGIALQFLKHYLGLSDKLLIQRINTDWSLQYFCGIQLKPGEVIKDTNLPSYWRCYIGKYLKVDAMQKILAGHWKPYINEQRISSQDATCYESRITYPTPVKIVWDCCHKSYLLYNLLRKQLGMRDSRCNYQKWKKEFLSYQKTKKKTKKAEKRLLKKLLNFLLLILELLKQLREQRKSKLSSKQSKHVLTIIKVYEQQHDKVYGKTDQFKDRIVSLSKPHTAPSYAARKQRLLSSGLKSISCK